MDSWPYHLLPGLGEGTEPLSLVLCGVLTPKGDWEKETRNGIIPS